MAEKVLVAGAGGRLGRHLLKELAARGYGVRALAAPVKLFDRRLYDPFEFGVAVGTPDVVAPADGTRSLAEYFSRLAAR